MVSEDEYLLYETIEGLHRTWMPHEVQAKIAKAIFYDGVKNVFVCAGRNNGKTENAAYCSWRWAKQNPGSENYIFEPYAKQGREILWASRRLQTFGPKEWIDGKPNETEMRIRFINESFIKVEGSDNSATMAGIKPKGIIVYDEFKDHRSESISNFEPNRAAFDVPALFIGTPPEFHNHFVDYMEMAKNSPDWLFIHAPTRSNPHISAKWLERKRLEMIAMGMEEDWLREYEAIFVKGGKKTIYPQFLKLKYLPLSEILPKDINKWTLVVGLDPASTSTFGVIFFLFNPFSKKIKVIDEIYEQDPQKMTCKAINEQIDDVLKKYSTKVRGVEYVYDEAAAWFRNELNEVSPDKWLTPSDKSSFGVDGYINLIRACLNLGLIEVAENCIQFIKEHEEYSKDDNGRIPKVNDHLINCIEENQLILTHKGRVKIKDVQVGHKVLTRLGWKTVLDVIDKGYAETISVSTEVNTLTCTAEHLLWSSNGWAEAASLKEGDLLCQSKQLSLMEYHGQFIQKENQKTLKDITLALQNFGETARKDICTDTFGLNTMGLFQKGIMFIIWTLTLTTTLSKILIVYLKRTTFLNTRTLCQQMEKTMLNLVTLKGLGRLGLLGTALRKARSGTLSMEKMYLETLSQKDSFVSTAKLRLNQEVGTLSFVAQLVSPLIVGGLGLMTLVANVLFVKALLLLTNTAKKELAHKIVKLASNGKQKVYDLTIDGCNEFYASGILVHNCFQYGVGSLGLKLTEDEEPKPIQQEEKRYFTFEQEFHNENRLEEFE